MSVLTQRHPALASLSDELLRTGRWHDWRQLEPRLAQVPSLQTALTRWRSTSSDASSEPSPECYTTVSALVGLGSIRGGDDPLAALAVVVLLHDGILALARDLYADFQRRRPVDDVVDDVVDAVWEVVRRAAPDLGPRAASFVLLRARKLVTTPDRRNRPPDGALVSIEALTERADPEGRSPTDGAPPIGAWHAPGEEVDTAVADLADLLAWARGHGVLAASDVALVVELMAVQRAGTPSETAHRILGQRHGVTVRTIRRRRAAALQRLRTAAPKYLAAVS